MITSYKIAGLGYFYFNPLQKNEVSNFIKHNLNIVPNLFKREDVSIKYLVIFLKAPLFY